MTRKNRCKISKNGDTVMSKETQIKRIVYKKYLTTYQVYETDKNGHNKCILEGKAPKKPEHVSSHIEAMYDVDYTDEMIEVLEHIKTFF